MAPRQKPGRSKQDYRTPLEFVAAVMAYLEIRGFDVDLAADEHNALSAEFFSATNSAFEAPTWKLGSGWNWLNPPYANIAPWVERAYVETADRSARTAVLVPAGVGANWWRDWVHGKAFVLFLNGRLSFDGIAPYPKDCALLLYSPERAGYIDSGDWPYDVWNWRP